MKETKMRISILALVGMLVTLIAVPTLALASTLDEDQKVTLYYPNGDWGLTPVERNFSVSNGDDIYLMALQQLTNPDTLPVGTYDEFPETFIVEDVSIDDETAYVTISDMIFEESELSNGWMNTLGDIISYNLFNMNKEISSVEFLSSELVKIDMTAVEKSELLSAPKPSLENIPEIDLDYQKLAEMSEEERNQAIQKAIKNYLGTQRLLAGDYTVVIDPGHGGYDPGAQVDGVDEKDLNLDIAKTIRDYLEGIDPIYPQFDVVMTRTSDEYVSLGDRHDLANDVNADIFVSIHNDAVSDSSVRGTGARFPSNHDVVLSEDLGNELINSITPDPLPKHSDARYQDIQVLRNTTMPATLVEVGFMTNSSDLYILQTEYDDIGYYMGIAINVWCQVNM